MAGQRWDREGASQTKRTAGAKALRWEEAWLLEDHRRGRSPEPGGANSTDMAGRSHLG